MPVASVAGQPRCLDRKYGADPPRSQPAGAPTTGRICLSNNAAERALRGIAMRRSLYPPSSSVCKHGKLIFIIDATRATCSPDRGSHPFMLKVGGSYLIWSARYNLLGSEDAVLDQPSDAVARDADHRSEFCGRVRTIIVDEDGIYDPRHPNDRLLLGMNGMVT
jgi:hypothetical protein